ncbi:unnamed protein product, partial [Closterium sp. NIES-53]
MRQGEVALAEPSVTSPNWNLPQAAHENPLSARESANKPAEFPKNYLTPPIGPGAKAAASFPPFPRVSIDPTWPCDGVTPPSSIRHAASRQSVDGTKFASLNAHRHFILPPSLPFPRLPFPAGSAERADSLPLVCTQLP